MRYILIIFFIFCCKIILAQSLLDQRLSFSVSEVMPGEALLLLADSAGVDIAYSPDFFKGQKKISIHTEGTIEQILKQIIKKSSLEYKVKANRIVLSKLKLPDVIVSGYISDAESGEHLISAAVFDPVSGRGTLTNEYGFYSLSVPVTSKKIEYSYLGYKSSVLPLNTKNNIQNNIQLNPGSTLTEIIITPEQQTDPNIENSSVATMSEKWIQAAPALGGVSDPIRTAQLLPGIQGGVDGMSGVQVRGSQAGHNLMLLDGVPVYIPYHLMGLYSIYNDKTVHSTKILKGTFPARYGGRLSSVFDIRTREGNKYNWGGQVGTTMNMASVLVEGPLKKEKSSFLIAGRFSPWSIFLGPALNRIYFEDQHDALYVGFYDMNIKANFSLSNKDRIYVSFFHGKDDFTREEANEDEEEIEEEEYFFSWQNTIAALRWNHLFNDKLFSNVTLTYSNYKYLNASLFQVFEKEDQEDRPKELFFQESRSNNQDIGLKFDLDYFLSHRHHLRMGLSASVREFVPDITYFEEDDDEVGDTEMLDIPTLSQLNQSEPANAIDLNVYVEDRISLSEKLTLNAGLRASAFSDTDDFFFHLEPRLSLHCNFTNKIKGYVSASKMVQYLHLISSSALRLPNDLWVPSTEGLLPQHAWQGEAGLRFQPLAQLETGVDFYYKTMQNLYTYRPEFSPSASFNDAEPSEYLAPGEGVASGMELFLKYNNKKSGGLLSYALTQSNRRYDAYNTGEWFPYAYDQRHQIKIFFYQQLWKNWRISANWIFNSPNPEINLIPTDSGNGFITLELYENGEKNNRRSQNYQRLDIDVSYNFNTKKIIHELRVGVYNLYNYNNIAYYRIEPDDEFEEFFARPVYGIPFTPSISYNMKF